MKNQKDEPISQEWLTLKDASELLGVHFTTLRAWADKGQIPVFRTPGGHRRFGVTDLRRFLDSRANRMLVPARERLIDAAVGRVRQQIQTDAEEASWRYELDEDAAVRRQQRGRQLFALAISFMLKPLQRERILKDGRRMGAEYGREAASHQIGLVETGRAVQFFRQQLVQAVRSEDSSGALDADDVRIQGLIDQFLDEILYAVLEGYETVLIGAESGDMEEE